MSIVTISKLTNAIDELNDQMQRDYGWSNHKLDQHLRSHLVKGSFQLHKVAEGYVLIQAVYLPNSDEPIMSATVKPKGADVWELLITEAERRTINKVCVYEPTNKGFEVIIQELR